MTILTNITMPFYTLIFLLWDCLEGQMCFFLSGNMFFGLDLLVRTKLGPKIN